MTAFPISRIVVGTRHRCDHGDIPGLAASMSELGLLHPIVVRPDGVLVEELLLRYSPRKVELPAEPAQ